MVHRIANPRSRPFGELSVVDVDPLRHVLLEDEPDFSGWQDYAQFLTTDDVRRLELYLQTLRELAPVPGDIVEIGVFRGGNLKLLALASEVVEPGGTRNLIGFDTFDGFPREQLLQPRELDKAAIYDGKSNLQAAVAKLVPLRCSARFVIGDVVETLARFYQRWGNRVALAYLDVDLLEPSRAALRCLELQLAVGGRILLDQYSRDGWSETQAVDEFLRRTGGSFALRRIPGCRAPSAYLEKLCERAEA